MKSALIIGNGGREHAIAWKLSQSARVGELFVAPGNAGTAELVSTSNVAIAVDDVPALIKFASDKAVDLIVVGPEASLAAGIADAAAIAGIPCVGPVQAAAQLETSKAFAKEFMQTCCIPTASFGVFTELQSALAYLHGQSFPVVVKADGLAAGKGVVIAADFAEGKSALESMLIDKQFGAAGQQVVIEEFLDGEELSFIGLSDGEHIIPLATSRDHKHRDEGDTGPNTGGMGAYSPVPLPQSQQDSIMTDIMMPVIEAMREAGHPYVGFLYAGLMLMSDGTAKVLEFNCRLGDPETQPLLMRLQDDLFELLEAAASNRLQGVTPSWDKRTAVTVVMVSDGYPGKYKAGHRIEGLDGQFDADCDIFHSGTKHKNGHLLTNGGRVLGVSALGETLQEAQCKAYAACEKIGWDGCDYRRDIGWRGRL